MSPHMQRSLKFCGALILNTIVALIGTAVLESTIGKAFRSQTLAAVLWKEWTLSLLCAAFVGFFIWRTWRVSAAMWVWVLPSIWFGLHLVLALSASRSESVLVAGGLWSQVSGTTCKDGVRALGCWKFFVVTIPFIRGVAYSVGAYLPSLVSKTSSQPVSESPLRVRVVRSSGYLNRRGTIRAHPAELHAGN